MTAKGREKLGGGRIEQKGKRTCGHRQQWGDLVEGTNKGSRGK